METETFKETLIDEETFGEVLGQDFEEQYPYKP